MFVLDNPRNDNRFGPRTQACLNCGSDSYFVRKYLAPVIISRAAANRVRTVRNKNTESAVQVVFVHLLCKLYDT